MTSHHSPDPILPGGRPEPRRSRSLLSAALLGLLALSTACKSSEAPQPPETAASARTSTAEPPSTATPAPAAAPSPGQPAAVTDHKVAGPSIHGFTMKRLDGTEASLSEWRGKVVLVVNTASKCGYTPQYEGLQALHAKYAERGFAVLGFPSNDFGGQEPGTSEEIAKFCTSIYSVNFPMFEKTKTVGPERSPLYALLSDAQGQPKWNFHKYLVDKRGRPVRAWASAVAPEAPEVVQAIEQELAAQ